MSGRNLGQVHLVIADTITTVLTPPVGVDLGTLSLTVADTLTTASVDNTSFAGECALGGDGSLDAAGVPRIPMNLGVVTVGTAATIASVTIALPGTLANPYLSTDTATWAVDFTSALFINTDPPPASGSVDAPSVWFRFTESQTADWVANTSGFTNGATLELYSGPLNAAGGDLTFVATDGDRRIDLGAVSVAALVGVAQPPLRVKLIDLGAVSIAAAPALTAALT